MQDIIRKLIEEALKNLNLGEQNFSVEHPADLKMGDYSTNVAMAASRNTAKDYSTDEIKLKADKIIISKGVDQTSYSPKERAEKIVEEINKNLPEEIEKVEVAGAGF